MDETKTINWDDVTEEDLEILKEILENAKANLKNAKRKFTKSKVNTSVSKVGNFLKTSVKKMKNAIGLLPYNIALGYNKVANFIEEKRTIRINKRTERRKFILSKIDTAKSKVGKFKKNIVDNFKKAVNKVKTTLGPDPEKKAALKEELIQLKEQLKAQREANRQLVEEGTYKNLRGSRGIVNSFALFMMLLLSCTITAIFLAITIFK